MKFVDKLLDFWFDVPKPAKHVAYGFLGGFVVGLIL
jgi:hypothetical protein